jgi:hypothetical protein
MRASGFSWTLLMARQAAPRMEYFSFPWWLCLGAIAFSILVSLIAGILPTRRAPPESIRLSHCGTTGPPLEDG